MHIGVCTGIGLADFVAAVDNAVAAYVDIFFADSGKTAIYNRSVLDVHCIVTFQTHHTDVMYTFAKNVGCTCRGRVWLVYKYVNGIVKIICFQYILTLTWQGEMYYAVVNAGLNIFGERTYDCCCRGGVQLYGYICSSICCYAEKITMLCLVVLPL